MKRDEGVALPAAATGARRPTLRFVPACVPGRLSEELVTPIAEKSKYDPSALVSRSTQIAPVGRALASMVAVWVQPPAPQASAPETTGGAVSALPMASTQESVTFDVLKLWPATVTTWPVAPTIDDGVTVLIFGGAT